MVFKDIKSALTYYAENYFEADNEHGKEQTRALFTTYCIMNDIIADSYECDELIDELHFLVPFGNEYSEFYNYMTEHIV